MVKIYRSFACTGPIGQVISRDGPLLSTNHLAGSPLRYLFAGANQYVSVLSLETGLVERYIEPPAELRGRSPVAVRALALIEERLLVGYDHGPIAVFHLPSYELQTVLRAHWATVVCLAPSEDEGVFLSAGLDGALAVWDLLSEEPHLL